ncbi:hypothetical protein NC653_035916 [Populus alba x Populus x berolinensis]|uniref:Uncharacterized protein n=1 Tax=Populus alba x Populus x berolinensis TaxID=444605 RepID=A0AAD6LL66_9ROSI|nr:hypothetical protein NC653_035916 [Populus alba x Populus x berolinensis]
MGLSSPDQVDLVSNATPRLNQTLPCPNSKISTLNPSLQNEIENENLGLPEKDIGSQGPRKKIVKKGFHGRLLRLLEMKWKSFNKKAYMRFSGVESSCFSSFQHQSDQINVLKFRFPDTQSAFNFHSSEFWTEITISGKLEASERKKLDGNVLFKAGKFRRAS